MGVSEVFDPTLEMLGNFWNGVATLLLAFVVFLIGWLIARLLMPFFVRLFKLVRIDNLVAASGFKEILEKGAITRSVSEMLGVAVYWILILIVIFTSLTVAGIDVPEAVVAELLAFIPRLILGLLVFVFSFFVGRLFKGIVHTSAANAGFFRPETLGKATDTAIVIFGSVLALQVIGIAASFIAAAFNIVLAAFAFGCALAFALGAKDIVGKWLEAQLNRKKPDSDSAA